MYMYMYMYDAERVASTCTCMYMYNVLPLRYHAVPVFPPFRPSYFFSCMCRGTKAVLVTFLFLRPTLSQLQSLLTVFHTCTCMHGGIQPSYHILAYIFIFLFFSPSLSLKVPCMPSFYMYFLQCVLKTVNSFLSDWPVTHV